MSKNIQAYEYITAKAIIANLPRIIQTYIPENFQAKPPKTDLGTILAGIMIGDSAGQPYEGFGFPKDKDPDTIPLIPESVTWTDDTAMTMAVLDAARQSSANNLSNLQTYICYRTMLKLYAKQYGDKGYGGAFYMWAVLDQNAKRYRSFGNGSAMRAGCLGGMFEDVEDVIRHACISAIPTHSHPEGIKGAIVTAVCTWMANHGATKKQILAYAEKHYPDGYRTTKEYFYGNARWMAPGLTIAELKNLEPITAKPYCQVSVPEAVSILLESDSFEICIRNILRFWCDTDTVGAIAGTMAAAYYGNTNI